MYIYTYINILSCHLFQKGRTWPSHSRSHEMLCESESNSFKKSSETAPWSIQTTNRRAGGITKSMAGLGNTDNTSDASKPILSATQAALAGPQG